MSPIGRIHHAGDEVRVEVMGEANYQAAGDLRDLLHTALEHLPQRLVVDLSHVGYMDSSGIATLIEMLRVQRQRGLKMVLCGLQPKVRSIFEIARLGAVFTIEEVGAAA